MPGPSIAVFHVRGVNIQAINSAHLVKMAGAGVSHAFGQSVYTYITGSSYCAGLDRTLKWELI